MTNAHANVPEGSAPRGLSDFEKSLEAIGKAVDVGRGCLDDFQIARAQADLEKVKARFGVGAGLTVAALAGGTGSGKSSLFNAMTGLSFADAGDIRPMTEEAAACVWNAEADSLLDMLGVRPARRIAYESLLVDTEDGLDGLVLLDLPDHDSVKIVHSTTVDSILPMVDVLIWVLDPQKYADHLIHDVYLSQMRRRKDHMIVLLNKTDTVLPERMDELMADVRAKLDADGLEGVALYAVSAYEESGLDPVREELRAAVAEKETGIRTAEAELDAIRVRLANGVGRGEIEISDALVEQTARQIAETSGIPAVVESLRHAGTTIRPSAIARPEKPASSMVSATRDAWMSKAKAGLPERWGAELDRRVPAADEIRRSIGAALETVALPIVSTRVPRLLVWIGILVAVLGVLQVVLPVPFDSLPVRIGLMAACLAFAGAMFPVSRRMQLSTAEGTAERFDSRSREAMEKVVRSEFVSPTQEVLDRHRRVREEVLKALGEAG